MMRVKKMSTMSTKDNLKKAGVFTDIHFGRKNASEIHNSDCLEFIEWFIGQCKKHSVDHIIFMGDWFEHRDSISGKTLDYSHKAMKLINDALDMPFFFIVGNHDLVYRNTRNAFNTKIFEPYENMIIIDSNKSYNFGEHKVLFSPFLFSNEYAEQVSIINSHDIVFGHFEFKGFVVTGETKTLEHGPEHKDFKKCKRIFTGHFHKRQEKDNVHYIGNTFPMDYSDANDSARGMVIYEYDSDNLLYIDWPDAPTYIKCVLSEALQDPKKFFKPKGTVNCLVDITMNYEEAMKAKKRLTEKYKLRELRLEEPLDDYTISEDVDIEDLKSESTSEVVLNLLKKIKSDGIKSSKLRKIYKDLVI